MKKNALFIGKIDKHLNNPFLQAYFKRLSKSVDIPIEFIKMDYKQFVARKHYFLNKKIEKQINLIQILKSTLIYISTYFYVTIFSKKIKKRKNVKIIFDEVFTKDDYNEIELLIKRFSDHVIISNQDIKVENQIIFSKRRGYNKDIVFSNFKNIFFFI